MKIKNIKKIILCLVSSATVCFAAATSAGCNVETAHPEVSITYEFNGKTYAVNYKLYRNMYPHTVKHFIELAENKFYDNVIIHDYKTNDWFTGAYAYNSEEYAAKSANSNSSEMAEYFTVEGISKEDTYVQLYKDNKLSASVYENVGADGKVIKSTKLPTVMGEFKNNIQQEIEKGALSADYGCLKMYYYDKESTQKLYVTPNSKQTILADYKTNSATSVFALQTGVSSSYSAANYTVFGMVKNIDTYDDFVDAVKDYIDEYCDGASDFYMADTDAAVDNFDEYSDKEKDKGIEVKFNVPKKPIIIKTVKVKKY